MSWESAKFHAKRAIEHVDSVAQIQGSYPSLIKLSDFESQDALDFLKPGNEWSLTFHRMVNRAFRREAKTLKIKTDIVMIKLDEYYDWISKEDIENSTANRAKYISLKTS